MKACSHIIEIKKFMNKCLVCDIQVQDISLPASGLHVQTNKWLHLEDWLEIDAALEKLLDPFRESENLDGFQANCFHLCGARAVRVDCKKTTMSRAHKRILGGEKAYLPFALEIQVTKIDTKELLDRIALSEERLNQLRQTIDCSFKEEDQNLVLCENMREYDPTLSNVGTEQASSDYVPYTASVKTPTDPSTVDTSGSVIAENEPYSPKPVSAVESSPDQISESPNEVPTYKPARIGQSKMENVQDEIVGENNNDHKKEEHSRPTKSLRRKRSPVVAATSKSSTSPPRHRVPKRLPSNRPKTTNAELFGSDDSDQEQLGSLVKSAAPQPSQSPKRVATPLRTPSTSDRLHREMKRKRLKLRHESAHRSPLDGWLSKGSIKKTDNTNGKSSKKPSRDPSSTGPKTEISTKLSEEQVRNQNLVELQQIKELSALRDAIKSKRKSPPPVMEILNLTHLSSEDILGTFEGIKPTLDEIFKKYSRKAKVTGFDGINHMKTLMLIDDKKQLQMMNFLRENYQPEEKGVPSLTDLYINALVPEWTVNVFMKEFNFTRTEAIDRLRAQEESSAHHNNESLDSSGPL